MCLIEDQSWIDCIVDITSRWDTFVLFHLYGNKGVSLPLWPIRPRWFHTYSPCAEPLGDGHEGMWARFGSQGSIALNWHSRYSGTRYSGIWLYSEAGDEIIRLWGSIPWSRQCISNNGIDSIRSEVAVKFVRNQMCTCPGLIKLICAIIICSSIGLVSSDSHLFDKAKIGFRTIGRPFWLALKIGNMYMA